MNVKVYFITLRTTYNSYEKDEWPDITKNEYEKHIFLNICSFYINLRSPV